MYVVYFMETNDSGLVTLHHVFSGIIGSGTVRSPHGNSYDIQGRKIFYISP